jgi:hypothetical protein
VSWALSTAVQKKTVHRSERKRRVIFFMVRVGSP